MQTPGEPVLLGALAIDAALLCNAAALPTLTPPPQLAFSTLPALRLPPVALRAPLALLLRLMAAPAAAAAAVTTAAEGAALLQMAPRRDVMV